MFSTRTPPDVSIVIPVYNASRTIGETLASVFAQKRCTFEVLVVDDGSRDGADLDAALRPWRTRIDLFAQPNQGAGAARNLALTYARGTFVAFLDADDTWHPSFLERQLALLQSRPEIDMVWSDGWIAGNTPLAGRTYLESTGTTEAPTFNSLARQTCTVLTSSVVAKRRLVDAVGRFDASIRRGQDFDLWLRLAHHGTVMAVHTEPLVWRRVHGGNLSGDDVAELERAIGVLDGIAAKLDLRPHQRLAVDTRIGELRSRVEIELAKRALRDGAIARAREHLSLSGTTTWKTRMAALGLRVAPHLLRRAYVRSSARSGGRASGLPT